MHYCHYYYDTARVYYFLTAAVHPCEEQGIHTSILTTNVNELHKRTSNLAVLAFVFPYFLAELRHDLTDLRGNMFLSVP